MKICPGMSQNISLVSHHFHRIKYSNFPCLPQNVGISNHVSSIRHCKTPALAARHCKRRPITSYFNVIQFTSLQTKTGTLFSLNCQGQLLLESYLGSLFVGTSSQKSLSFRFFFREEKRRKGGGKMAFTGTLDKCKACDKTVYFVDLLSADGVTYHKSCFKCSHCKGTLVMSNYSSMDGVLYCKPHFEQLFKECGNFSKNFQTSGKTDKENSLSRGPSKLSSLFSGTQDKCSACNKTVYPLEKVTMEGELFHKSCFKCAHGGCPLTHSSYAALNGVLYCRHHFAQLFMEKGNYSHVLEAANQKKNTTTQSETESAEEEEPKTEPEETQEQS